MCDPACEVFLGSLGTSTFTSKDIFCNTIASVALVHTSVQSD